MRMRQALAGMLWTKQYFFFDVDLWLTEHGQDPMQPGGRFMRNNEWFHMVNNHIISIPDKWEYPWYAAWDLAFHTIALSTVDPEFAKPQLDLTASGKLMNLFEVAREIANRLEGIFLRDKSGRRPVYGGTQKFQTDPQWKDYILFFEYFQGDNGAGLGASHQTGWTGVVAKLIELFGRFDGRELLDAGKAGGFAKERTEEVEPASV